MTLSMKTYTCSKCGRVFTRWEGGVVPPVMKELTPVCDKCKKNEVKEIISKISENFSERGPRNKRAGQFNM